MAIENLVPWRRRGAIMSSPISSSPFASGPVSSISSLQREMNRMFDNIWSSSSMLAQSPTLADEVTSLFYPDVEMSETNGRIEISAELPGVSEKDIDVTLSPDGSTLDIKGEKRVSKERKDTDYYCAERAYGAFRRTMSLPSAVNPDKVDAKFHNGVLVIRLDKVDDRSRGVKHIDIKAT